MYLLEPQVETYVESHVSLTKYKLVLSYIWYVLQYFSGLKKIRLYGSDCSVRSSQPYAYEIFVGKILYTLVDSCQETSFQLFH